MKTSRELFEEWWKQYLADGGRKHFDIWANKEPCCNAWNGCIAAIKANQERGLSIRVPTSDFGSCMANMYELPEEN